MAYIIDSNQYLFDKVLWAIWKAIKIIFKLTVYLPLWFAGYQITSQILIKNEDSLNLIALTILFALLIYQVIFFTKGLIISLKIKGNLFWLPLFIVCICFTCVLPTWFIHSSIQPWLHRISPNSGNLMAWLTSIFFGIYVYSRYHFLTDNAPMAALFSYQLGKNLVLTTQSKNKYIQ